MPADTLHRLGQKTLDAKAKHRWLMACAEFRPFMDAPGVLRLAILLFEYYNPRHGYAYPSRRTLADRLGSPPESVSRWMRSLKACHAITVEKAGDVSEEVRKATRKTTKRANYYALNFGWAEIVLEGEPDVETDDFEESKAA